MWGAMRCYNEQTNVFVNQLPDIDRQREDQRSLQAHPLRTSRYTGLTRAPYREFLHESGRYPNSCRPAIVALRLTHPQRLPNFPNGSYRRKKWTPRIGQCGK